MDGFWFSLKSFPQRKMEILNIKKIAILSGKKKCLLFWSERWCLDWTIPAHTNWIVQQKLKIQKGSPSKGKEALTQLKVPLPTIGLQEMVSLHMDPRERGMQEFPIKAEDWFSCLTNSAKASALQRSTPAVSGGFHQTPQHPE